MLSNTLPDFQKFLVSRKFVVETKAPYYAYWVSQFLAFLNNIGDLSQDLQVKEFLNYLKNQTTIYDWQIQQAEQALKLYINHFLTSNPFTSLTNTLERRQIHSNISEGLNKIQEAIRIKHYSYRTERSYIDWIKRFYDYLLKVKKKGFNIYDLDSSDVKDFLSYLAIKQRVSSSTQNQAFSALLFLFRVVLKKDLDDIKKTVRAKRVPKIPTVLSVEEIQELFKHVRGKDLLILQLLYGSGLRLMELARLRIQDVDLSANLIFVRSGKQDKDRSTLLPEYVKDKLSLHLEEIRSLHEEDLKKGFGEVYLPDATERKYLNAGKDWCWQYVFPAANLSIDPRSGKVRRHHISERSIQIAVKDAAREAAIAKHVTVHTLRHTFATHLLMNGVNIREIQELLGHKNLETTMIYTHVLRDMTNIPKSPLDNLYEK